MPLSTEIRFAGARQTLTTNYAWMMLQADQLRFQELLEGRQLRTFRHYIHIPHNSRLLGEREIYKCILGQRQREREKKTHFGGLIFGRWKRFSLIQCDIENSELECGKCRLSGANGQSGGQKDTRTDSRSLTRRNRKGVSVWRSANPENPMRGGTICIDPKAGKRKAKRKVPALREGAG